MTRFHRTYHRSYPLDLFEFNDTDVRVNSPVGVRLNEGSQKNLKRDNASTVLAQSWEVNLNDH